jgi:hypothetical protein
MVIHKNNDIFIKFEQVFEAEKSISTDKFSKQLNFKNSLKEKSISECDLLFT